MFTDSLIDHFQPAQEENKRDERQRQWRKGNETKFSSDSIQRRGDGKVVTDFIEIINLSLSWNSTPILITQNFTTASCTFEWKLFISFMLVSRRKHLETGPSSLEAIRKLTSTPSKGYCLCGYLTQFTVQLKLYIHYLTPRNTVPILKTTARSDSQKASGFLQNPKVYHSAQKNSPMVHTLTR